jgi:hypothetical protein
MIRAHYWSLVVAVIAATGALGGVATAAEHPAAHPGYEERVQTATRGRLVVAASALSAEESEAVYGAPLAEKGIQPVWVVVENRDDVPYWLMFPGVDPNFFPASEAAEAVAADGDSSTLAEFDSRFRRLAFHNPVPPGGIVSGFVLTSRHEGVKLVELDLFADRRSASVSFVVPVPGLRTDYEESKDLRQRLLQSGRQVDYTDDAAFVAALEALPCCVTNKDGSRNGDPLNLVIVGGVEDAFPALIRRGWTPTEVTWKGSVLRMVRSALARERYPYAPVSNLYLFGRPQDIALQKARDNIHQRNHLRLWRSPMNWRGRPVWVGQISRDIGSRMTIHSPTLTTHKIDPDVDEAARALAEDMVYSQGLRAIGLVAGVGAASADAPRENLTTDPYYTNGLRHVLVFDNSPTSLTEIEFLPWRMPGAGYVEQAVSEPGP